MVNLRGDADDAEEVARLDASMSLSPISALYGVVLRYIRRYFDDSCALVPCNDYQE